MAMTATSPHKTSTFPQVKVCSPMSQPSVTNTTHSSRTPVKAENLDARDRSFLDFVGSTILIVR